MKTLSLTEDEFECLHTVVADTIGFLESEGDNLSDYGINEVFNKLNRLKED
jgi:flagellar biosynthesis/type III secretory pathway M-ring protein FliF/YscJ